MIKHSLLASLLLLCTTLIMAEETNTKQVDNNVTKIESNQKIDANSTKEDVLKKQIKKQETTLNL